MMDKHEIDDKFLPWDSFKEIFLEEYFLNSIMYAKTGVVDVVRV